MGKKFLFWCVFVLSMLAAIYLSVRIVMATNGTSNIAPVAHIVVHTNDGGDIGKIPAEQITGALQINGGANALSLDMSQLATRISVLPGVEMSSVRRRASGRIDVRIEQNNIIAAWTDGTDFYPLSDDGKIIAVRFAARPHGIPVFAGAVPNDISAIVNMMRDVSRIADITDHIEWIENRRADIYTNGGVRIMLPDNNAEMALKKLSAIDAHDMILSRKISLIDMRDRTRILVK